MTSYRTSDGEAFSANTAREAVTKLRALSLDPGSNVTAFKEAVATRVFQTTGATIHIASDARFIDDLIRAGLITEEGDAQH